MSSKLRLTRTLQNSSRPNEERRAEIAWRFLSLHYYEQYTIYSVIRGRHGKARR
jgi:hypothetical protein